MNNEFDTQTENFLQPDFVQQLKSDGKIYTACGDGKIPFISAKDIAAVAATLLTRKEKPEAIEYRLIGPRHHSYDDVCNIQVFVKGRNR
jgi:festuclavine dehydrogenase